MIYQIKCALRKWSDHSEIGSMVFQFARKTVAKTLLIMPDGKYAKWFHKMYTGKTLDLDNPRTFDEKLWWLKLNNRDSLLTRCSDKYAVRDYVIENDYEETLIPLLGLYENAEDIPFESYKDEVFIKCTSGSGENCFYTPNKINEKKKIIKRLNYALKQNPYLFSREWNYKNVPPRIVVEKVIRDRDGKLPLDYKFMCFDGEPKLLFLDLGLIDENRIYNENYPRNIYDMDFNLLPVHESRPNADYPIEKPENFEYMVEMARTLSKPFPHCRVDLYNLDGKVYFGEITFYHGGGCNNIQPEEWDYKMGSWIDINSTKIVRS